MSHEKYFDVVQKLKLVWINVVNFRQNGTPYRRVIRESKTITPNKGTITNAVQTVKGYPNLCHVDVQ